MKILIAVFFLVCYFQIYDSLKSTPQDTVQVNIIENESWIEKNEGALIGAFGGGVTAVLAAFLTYYLSKVNRRKKEKKVYEGLLYSIHTELDWQKNHTRALRNQLGKVKRLSIESVRFVVDEAPNKYDTRYLEYCRERILEYDNFTPQILALLSTYINLLLETNVNIDFRAARSLHIPEGESLTPKLIEGYFETIEKENLDKIEKTIPLIRSLIEHDLEDFPEDLLVNRENEKSEQNG